MACNIDFVLISKSEAINYEEYNSMPLDRIDLFRHLVQLRMAYFDGGFRSHLDLLNRSLYGKYFGQASYAQRRNLLNIWNLPSLNSFLAVSSLVNSGFNCKIIGNFDSEFDILLMYCKQMEPPIVGISTTFMLQWQEAGRLANKIREAVPGAIIILGGAFVSHLSLANDPASFERPMRKYGLNYIIYSHNSERDLSSLVKAIKAGGRGIEDVHNLAYLDSGNNYRLTKSLWNDPVLDEVIPFKDILGAQTASRTLQIRTSAGCPFHCAFCSYPAAAKVYKHADISCVKRQIEEIKRVGGIDAIVFIDDTINTPPKRFKELVALLSGYGFRWYAFYRAQYADADIAREMKDSGCDGLFLGLESANDSVLKNMNKKATAAEYKRGVEALSRCDIPLFGAFVVGFPGETESSINDNIEFIESSGLDFYSIKEFFYLHVSPIHYRSSEFSLKGEGYRWEHSTMTSIQASEMKLKMFQAIKKSVHIDPDLGLWYLIYLRDRGFDWERITGAQKLINEMVSRDNAARYTDKEDLFKGLADIRHNAVF